MSKERIIQEVENLAEDLILLSHRIHGHPEIGGQEIEAVQWQKELLSANGFSFESPYCGMDTAYLSCWKGNGKGPVIAFLSEYDALEGLGHGCGHNLIASASVGAAISLAKTVGDQVQEIRVYGTPAEETWGGKIPMVEQKKFQDVDFALMFHPATENVISRSGKACVGVDVTYFGKSAHSASPETGINALTALIGLFNRMFEGLKVWPPSGRANGIISRGGDASNIITEEAEGSFLLRAATLIELERMAEDFKRFAEEAAQEVGVRVEMVWESAFAERYPNKEMGKAFARNMDQLGVEMHLPDPHASTGSSDIGNVSLVVPAIHEYLAIADPSVNGHSVSFREASASTKGDEVILLAAKGLGMTGYDLLTDPDLQKKVKEEFEKEVPKEYRER